ncbi:aa3-type cytochrome c oxidase subunit IV [Tabrizicola sp.]|jgi:Ni,Fe-hydrogenase I cytochrome b subunit|nr:aa3-type cytochrome c oxidase subunit IV [Tabrizicola sp.]MBL9061382.1 aa3-type cytochrome c oxidase subunit IV [Tabrizicola sp.]
MADHHHAEHVQGSMDIRAQEKTFAGFIRVSVWVAGLAIAVLIFLALANS